MTNALIRIFGTSKAEMIIALKIMRALLIKRNDFNDAVFLCRYFGQSTELADRVRLLMRKPKASKCRKSAIQT
jgi:hypothetical protein